MCCIEQDGFWYFVCSSVSRGRGKRVGVDISDKVKKTIAFPKAFTK